MRTRTRIPVLVVVALNIVACVDAESPTPPRAPVATTVTDDQSSVRLDVSLDRAAMTTTDQLQVHISVTRPLGLSITMIEPDWSAANWTLLDTIDTAPLAGTNGTITRARTVILEPFLDGDYSVPPVTLSWDRAGDPALLASQPLPVKVESVLPQEDDRELAAALPVTPPPVEPGRTVWIPAAVGVCGLAALATAWFLVRRRPQALTPEPTPHEVLRAETSSESPDLARIHKALSELSANGNLPPETLARFEKARFDPRSGPHEAVELARSAMPRIGENP